MSSLYPVRKVAYLCNLVAVMIEMLLLWPVTENGHEGFVVHF